MSCLIEGRGFMSGGDELFCNSLILLSSPSASSLTAIFSACVCVWGGAGSDK